MTYRKTWIAGMLACLIGLAILAPAPVLADEPVPAAIDGLLPYRYARIWQKPVSVYSAPGDPTEMTPIQSLLPPDSWVSIDAQVQSDGQLWYRIDRSGYVLASEVVTDSVPSLFQGIVITGDVPSAVGFVVADELNVRARPGTADDNPPVAGVSRYQPINVEGSEVAPDGTLWYRIGENQYVRDKFVRVAYPVARPAEIPPTDRWIAVDVAQQALTAYEGDRMVFATLVSTGREPWVTPQGLFRIWVKLQTGRMQGGEVERGDNYYLQDVPWIMYFNRDVGLHASYWHDNFGTPRSHGCVNLSPLDAKWFYEWTSPVASQPSERVTYPNESNPGTWVYVYKSA